jgi:hypothetical protein
LSYVSLEQLVCNLMFRWFVGLSIDDPVLIPSTSYKNWGRLAQAAIGRRLFEEIVEIARWRRPTFNGPISFDATLIQSWAFHRSVRRKDASDTEERPVMRATKSATGCASE